MLRALTCLNLLLACCSSATAQEFFTDRWTGSVRIRQNPCGLALSSTEPINHRIRQRRTRITLTDLADSGAVYAGRVTRRGFLVVREQPIGSCLVTNTFYYEPFTFSRTLIQVTGVIDCGAGGSCGFSYRGTARRR